MPFVLVCFISFLHAVSYITDSALWNFHFWTRFCYMLWCIFTVCIFWDFRIIPKRHHTHTHTKFQTLVFLKLKICAVVIFEHLRHHNVEFYCYCWKAVPSLSVSFSFAFVLVSGENGIKRIFVCDVSWKQRKNPIIL